jgi:hypothetical protein
MEASAHRERPVFVAADGRRARQLRYAALAALALSCLWLGGLLLGTVGFGELPGLQLPDGGRAADRPVVTPRRTAEPPSSAERASIRAEDALRADRTAVARSPKAPAPAGARTVSRRRTSQKPTARPTVPVAVPPQPAAAPLPVSRQGWAQRGLTEPSGQTRRTTVQ